MTGPRWRMTSRIAASLTLRTSEARPGWLEPLVVMVHSTGSDCGAAGMHGILLPEHYSCTLKKSISWPVQRIKGLAIRCSQGGAFAKPLTMPGGHDILFFSL